MPQNYVPIFVFLCVAFLVAAGTLAVAKIARPHNPNKVKGMAYECGIETVGDTWVQFKVQYYIFALVFVVFDVETIFLYPWAVQYKQLGVFGFLEMLVFLGILVLGYLWVWKKGALEWI